MVASNLYFCVHLNRFLLAHNHLHIIPFPKIVCCMNGTKTNSSFQWILKDWFKTNDLLLFVLFFFKDLCKKVCQNKHLVGCWPQNRIKSGIKCVNILTEDSGHRRSRFWARKKFILVKKKVSVNRIHAWVTHNHFNRH